MKLYTDYSPSHKVFFDDYFLPTFPKVDLELVVAENPQECPSGTFYEPGWAETCVRKSKLVLQACQENMGTEFVFSDVDVQFFGEIADTLLKELGDCDIACQNDTGNTYCAGFFVCRANERTLSLFQSMVEKFECDDQHCLNKFIGGCRAKFLSRRFFTIGHAINKLWTQASATLRSPLMCWCTMQTSL